MPEKQFYLYVIVSPFNRVTFLMVCYRAYHFQGCQSLEYVPPDKRDNKIVILAKRTLLFHSLQEFLTK